MLNPSNTIIPINSTFYNFIDLQSYFRYFIVLLAFLLLTMLFVTYVPLIIDTIPLIIDTIPNLGYMLNLEYYGY